MGEDENKQVRGCSLRLVFLSIFILCVLFTLFALLSQDVKADTYVGEIIGGDTTWNASGSPYIVNQDVSVDKDGTLTIEPDVEVKFNFTDLTVYGRLLAIGNESHPIIFSSNTNFGWGGIIIEDTGDAHFNWCRIYKGEYGFDLMGPQACSIQNTTISESNYGIYLRECSDLSLSDINVSSSINALYLYECSRIKFFNVHIWDLASTPIAISSRDYEEVFYNHTFIDCTMNGRPLYNFYRLKDIKLQGLYASHISLYWCENVTLKQCRVEEGSGIIFFNTVGSEVVDCNISSNYRGIELETHEEYTLNFSLGNIISNNFFENNSDGIRLVYSDNNIIFDNQFISNTNGIYSYYTSNNLIYRNNFIDNNRNAYQTSSIWYANSYDNGEEGNYWDDYDGEDIGGDGIGDESHYIGSGSRDFLPLMAPWTGSLPPDTIPPYFLENPELSEDILIIPEEFVWISFEVSERGRYEIIIDTDEVEGFDNSTDTVVFGDLEGLGIWHTCPCMDSEGNYLEDGIYGIQTMIWDRAGNPADEPFNLGNVTIHRDMDGDGHYDVDDAFPDDPHEWSDMDGDGIGDNSDLDMDGDGVENGSDEFPTDPDEWSDMDGDNIGDNADPDDNDNDIPDIAEIPLVLFILVIPLLVFYYTNKHVSGKKEAKKEDEEEKKEEKE